MKAFITKYAMTQGILERDGHESDHSDGLLCIPSNYSNGSFNFSEYYHTGEWFKTRQEAIVKAEEMRQKKIKSLEKQLVRLKEMQFI